MADYKILEVIPATDIDAKGRFMKIYRVKFEFNGIEDWVDVTEEEYLEGKHFQKIEEIVRKHMETLSR